MSLQTKSLTSARLNSNLSHYLWRSYKVFSYNYVINETPVDAGD